MNFISWLTEKYKTDYGEATRDELIQWIKDVHSNLLSEESSPYSGRHYGDCTRENITCLICEYQNWLDGYEKYCKSFKE